MKAKELIERYAKSERKFKGVDLRYSDFGGASLMGVDLRGANLWQSSFHGADLTGANLAGSDLWRSSLLDADLTGADLTGTCLDGADLRGAVLRGANLHNTKFDSCVGNGREIKTIQTDMWMVTYTVDAMQIGCEKHPISKWWVFSERQIHYMDHQALVWWRRWKPILEKIIYESPASPTGHEGDR